MKSKYIVACMLLLVVMATVLTACGDPANPPLISDEEIQEEETSRALIKALSYWIPAIAIIIMIVMVVIMALLFVGS